uniref:Nucleic-acid-binding protein from transposon x-element n=1 Tax=Lutzomyia longipalpis TaxID=7200 RepID=A0A1B0CQQ0_LUTLO
MDEDDDDTGAQWQVATGKRKGPSPSNRRPPLKQPKIINWLGGVSTANRFNELDEENTSDNNTNGEQSTSAECPKREPRPPPIFIYKVEQIEPLTKLLNELAPNLYTVKVLGNSQMPELHAHKEFLPKISQVCECLGSHLTKDCDRKERSEDVKCVNCGRNHPANYRGCEVYKELQRKLYPSPRPRRQETVNLPPDNGEHSPRRTERTYSDTDTNYNLWKATKGLKRPQQNVPPIRNQSGGWARSSEEKAEVFSRHLLETFNPWEMPQDDEFVASLEESLGTPFQMELPILLMRSCHWA